MQSVLKVNVKTANIIVAVALLLGMPMFTFSVGCRTASAASGS